MNNTWTIAVSFTNACKNVIGYLALQQCGFTLSGQLVPSVWNFQTKTVTTTHKPKKDSKHKVKTHISKSTTNQNIRSKHQIPQKKKKKKTNNKQTKQGERVTKWTYSMPVVADQWQCCGSKLALDRASAASAFDATERRELRMRGERESSNWTPREIMCAYVSVNLVDQIPWILIYTFILHTQLWSTQAKGMSYQAF